MKRRNLLFPLLITAMGWGSCAKNDPGNVGNGSLVVRLDVDPTVRVVTASATKSADAATFTLEILQNETVIKKLSPIGVDPGPIELPSGVYTVRTYSQSFTAPAFDTPVYGGSAGVSIAVDNETPVSIGCKQTNAGVRVSYSEAFRANHSTRSTTIRQIQGALTFTDDDVSGGRIGYFPADRATIVVTADGVEYEQELTLDTQTVYNVSVDDAPQSVSGNLKLDITVSTDVSEQDVAVVFPSGVVDYTETMGGVPVSVEQNVSGYAKWSYLKASYAGSGAFVSSAAPSDYNGASGGNYLLFKTSCAYFTVSGLNTSMAANDLVLSFGCCSFSQAYDVNNLTVSVSQDEGANFTQLPIASDARPANKKWAQVSVTEGIPKTKNLVIRFDCLGTNYGIDDIRLKTL